MYCEKRYGVGRVRVAGFTVSLDGYGAGPEQSLQDPPYHAPTSTATDLATHFVLARRPEGSAKVGG